jgi:hypothetical protein
VDLYLYQAEHALEPNALPTPNTVEACLERYPRDLRYALALAECGQVSDGYAVLLRGLVDARELGYELLERVYEEALGVYESRYAVLIQ